MIFNEIDRISIEACRRRVFDRPGLTVLCDFEKGLLKALSTLSCGVRGCYFHFTQAVWRFVSKHNLSGRYQTSPDFRWSVRHLMVLPLFPQHLIPRIFQKLYSRVRHDTGLVSVYNYFREVWILGHPIALWCQNASQFRTNNFAESFHASLARRFIPSHPTFYAFLTTINRVIEENKIELETERRNPKTKRSIKDTARTKISMLIENYVRGPPLALELDALLKEIFGILHNKHNIEDDFEDDKTLDDGDSSDVPMDIVEDGCQSAH